MRAQGAVASLFDIFFAILLILIGAAVCGAFILHIPNPKNAPANSVSGPITAIYNGVFGFFDASFLFLFVITMLIDVLISWFRPSVAVAIGNIILLFALAYFSLFINIAALTFNNSLAFNSVLPITYQFFSSGWYLLVVFFVNILCIIFNFRRVNKVEVQYA